MLYKAIALIAFFAASALGAPVDSPAHALQGRGGMKELAAALSDEEKLELFETLTAEMPGAKKSQGVWSGHWIIDGATRIARNEACFRANQLGTPRPWFCYRG